MEHEEAGATGFFALMAIILIGGGYWWGSSNEPEVKIVEKSVYTEREKCDKLGGDFSAFDTHWGDQKDFSVECKIPAKSIEI